MMGMSGRGLLSRQRWWGVRESRSELAPVGLLVLLALVCFPLSECLVCLLLRISRLRSKRGLLGFPRGTNRLWCKGYSGALTRETLTDQARLYVKLVNDEKGTNFNPKVFAWSLEIAAALVFDDSDDAQAFYEASEGVMFTWAVVLEGVEYSRRLRIVKDASFDQRCRSQVCYRLRLKLIELLGSKGLWHDGMQVGNTGPRGVVFGRAVDGLLFEMFRIDASKRGEGELLSPRPSRLLRSFSSHRRRLRSWLLRLRRGQFSCRRFVPRAEYRSL